MKLCDVIVRLQELEDQYGSGEEALDVVVDTGTHLCKIEDIDLGASDEGVVIWVGDVVE